MLAPKQKPVTKRVAVICKDESAFGDFMSNFQISMFSRAKKKFWANKGATEYMMVTAPIDTQLSEVIMLGGCMDQIDLYIALQKNVTGPLMDKEEKEQLADIVQLTQEEVAHGEQENT